ncbi:hypothetical protein V8E54_000677 [Elaphomyces granulatus]
MDPDLTKCLEEEDFEGEVDGIAIEWGKAAKRYLKEEYENDEIQKVFIKGFCNLTKSPPHDFTVDVKTQKRTPDALHITSETGGRGQGGRKKLHIYLERKRGDLQVIGERVYTRVTRGKKRPWVHNVEVGPAESGTSHGKQKKEKVKV